MVYVLLKSVIFDVFFCTNANREAARSCSYFHSRKSDSYGRFLKHELSTNTFLGYFDIRRKLQSLHHDLGCHGQYVEMSRPMLFVAAGDVERIWLIHPNELHQRRRGGRRRWRQRWTVQPKHKNRRGHMDIRYGAHHSIQCSWKCNGLLCGV